MSIFDAFKIYMGTFSDFIHSPDSAYFLLIPLTLGLFCISYYCFKSWFSKRE